MEFLIENLWYIENKIGIDVYQDAAHNVYVIPRHPVLYSEIFKEVSTFNKFYDYAHKKRDEKSEEILAMALTYIYIKMHIKNASMKDLLNGYKALRVLAEENKSSYIIEKIKKSKSKIDWIEEEMKDSIFLESNTYLSNLKPGQFYRMECMLAKHFFKNKQILLAYRYAKEALEVASRSACSKAVEEARKLLIKIEREKNRTEEKSSLWS